MIDFGYGVTLGPLLKEHQTDIMGWRNHISVRKWCRQATLISDSDQERWFQSQAQDPSVKFFMIHDAVGRQRAGVCGLTSIDRINRRAEFSLYVHKNSQGHRRGEAALKTLLDHAFLDLNLNCVWGESFDENPAIKMFQELGFKLEGTRREFYFRNGKYIPCHLFSMLASEWRASHGTWVSPGSYAGLQGETEVEHHVYYGTRSAPVDEPTRAQKA